MRFRARGVPCSNEAWEPTGGAKRPGFGWMKMDGCGPTAKPGKTEADGGGLAQTGGFPAHGLTKPRLSARS